jgi:S-adenosylmethionine decarboxylase
MVGTHIIVDAYDINEKTFIDINLCFDKFNKDIAKIISNNNMTILNTQYHIFSEYIGAFTCLYLLAESHVSFHTWPEKNYIAIDVFTCGSCNTDDMVNEILKYLNCTNYDKKIFNRGLKCDKS